MISRYFVSLNLAAIITFSLFLLLQMLISSDEILLMEPRERVKIELGTVRPVEPVSNEIEPPVRPEEVTTPQPPTVVVDDDAGQIGPDTTLVFNDDVDTVGPDTFTNIFLSEGDFIAIVRPAPQYPAPLAQKGIEGYVNLSYTITALGNTDNVIVMSSTHSGFERNAVKAAKKFKFKPRVVDGGAQTVHNVLSTIEFKLEN